MADEREETLEITLPIQVTRGLVNEIIIPAFGTHTGFQGAEVVGATDADPTRAAVFLEPQRRADVRTGVTDGWDEEAWREIVRAAAQGLGYDLGGAYTLVWDPGSDRTGEEPLTGAEAEG
jgi:hypothetical protein